MKNMLKLAAIAVSTVLAMSFIACSSGDDDVVDASTPKYLLTAQIDKYVASIEYDQNVSDAEIKSLKDANTEMMKIVGDCEDCLAYYFDDLKGRTDGKLDSDDIKDAVDYLKGLKANTKYNKETEYHKRNVYKPAIEKAIGKVDTAKAKVEDIGNPDGNTILEGKLNARQSANMKEYIDAVAALKNVLIKTDATKCETAIKAADKAIEDFNKLENKNVTKAKIGDVIKAVDDMESDITEKVLKLIEL